MTLLFDEREDLMDERLKFMSDQMKLGVKAIEENCGVTITDEDLANANKECGRMAFKAEMLTQLCTNANPPVVGGETLTMLQQCLTVPFNTGFKYLEDAIDTLTKEVRAAIKAGEGVMPKGHPEGRLLQPALLRALGRQVLPRQRRYHRLLQRSDSLQARDEPQPLQGRPLDERRRELVPQRHVHEPQERGRRHERKG